MSDKIYIGSDHAGFKLKESIKKFLMKQGYNFVDEGAYKFLKTDDYPDFALRVAESVSEDNAKGILICDTGQGVTIAANKVPGIRAAPCIDKKDAKHASMHLNANIITIGADKASLAKAKIIVQTWLKTKFKRGARHVRRIDKVRSIERRY